MRFFAVYQYAAPLLLFPVGYLLWLDWYGGDHGLVLLTMSIPVVFAYVVPGIGTNWLGLWEINTTLRLGRFRPHHGFVFGTATSILTLLCLQPPTGPVGAGDIARGGFVVGSVLAFWNWLYDLLAIRAGFITVYNRPYRDGRGPEAIATDYAPVLFGVFGAWYGVAILMNHHLLHTLGRTDLYWWLLAAGNVLGIALPVIAFCALSYARHGDAGLVACRETSS